MRSYSIFRWLVPICLFLGVTLNSCSEKSDPIPNLVLEKQTVQLKPGETVSIKIQSGGNTYKAISSNPELLKASITNDEVVLEAGEIDGDAEAKVYISDANYNRVEIEVTISSYEQLVVNKSNLTISQILFKDTLTVSHGEAPYKVTINEPSLVDLTHAGNKIYLTARAQGSGIIQITDAKSKIVDVALKVEAPRKSMNFSDRYFGHANFGDIAVVDQSVKKLTQATFEMTCNLQGYRGLQTFMGLEGNLIIRGKNDDYRETHPIEIAGLGDKIMLETASSFKLNTWMNLALVFDGTKTELNQKYRLFIDGLEQTLIVRRSEASHQTIDLTSSNDGGRFEIGRANGQEWRALRGMVSEARIWTVARTAEQLKNESCSLSEDKPVGLLAKWDFSIGTDSNLIPDSNKGKYKTDLIISNTKAEGSYLAVNAPISIFSAFNCPF
ncbi:LamG-like jellyroll fold domain-containing protein [Sphingobacterium hungaricum]|uniref:Concanavalin A-like lectin/glucanases superfamily protein n=1 Tax=Sphingobacterium hungaricum TaxID=2082723 RepID=A0A928UY62_9SPHI|nr:LamG-like jellyroll fold domain-containing protein [Sphingobacterium hungaricum]MBE8715178.1 hypothetical protein [Sphingobacterium hungaricum]